MENSNCVGPRVARPLSILRTRSQHRLGGGQVPAEIRSNFVQTDQRRSAGPGRNAARTRL